MTSSELFEKILNRPGLYVGQESVTKMKAFIDGYEFANRSESIPIRDPLYADFQDWVARRFKINTAHDWASIVSFMGLSERGSFELLRELWEEHKKKFNNPLR